MKFKLEETSKLYDIYFKGAFWIVADSYRDIQKGNFEIIGNKIPVSFEGVLQRKNSNKKNETHKALWRDIYNKEYPDLPFNYFPRGRVEVYGGVAYVNIHSMCNTPKVINKIIKEYNLSNLELEIECNDESQGSHYDFLLK